MKIFVPFYKLICLLLVLSAINKLSAQTTIPLNCPNTDPTITSWMISDGVTTTSYYTDINDAGCDASPTIVDSGVEADVQAVYYDADYVWIEATGCPAHLTGPYNGDGNPNFPGDQARTIVIPRIPTASPGSTANDYDFLGEIGFMRNGVSIFNATDGMTYTDGTGGVWNRNAIVYENLGFGCDRTHPAGDNLHYHQNPIPFNYSTGTQNPGVCDCFPSTALYSPDPSIHSPLLGFAIDGFPIYGPYAYANTDGTGAITLMTSSYQFSGVRNVSTADPDITTYPLGSFYEDYAHVAGSGTLDYYNGRFAVTPEYPCGTYAYYTTMDANGDSTFPYVIGLEFYGEVVSCNLATGGGGGPGGGMGFCGDGICDGPETVANCPGDCDTGGGDDICDIPATATLYAQSGDTPSCTSTLAVNTDCADPTSATLTGSGLPGGDVSGTTSFTYDWCTTGGNIVTSPSTVDEVDVDQAGTYYFYTTDANGYTSYTSTTTTSACILPVELTVFEGAVSNDAIILNWETSSELNNSHFEVEHSADGKSFLPMTKIIGAGTTIEAQTYNFVDNAPINGNNYYRLKQVDFDGHFEYSNIIVIAFGNRKTATKIYPSPVGNTLNIASEGSIIAVSVFDITGQLKLAINSGDLSQLDVSGLVPSTYIITIQFEDHDREILRFLKEW